MKKLIILFIFCFIVSPLLLFADEEVQLAENDNDDLEAVEIFDYDDYKHGAFRIKDRTVEVGLININLAFANDFLTTKQIFQNRMVIDLDELKKGYRMNLDFGMTFLSFAYNHRNEWGFGIIPGVDAAGVLNLSGNMLTIDEAENERSDVSGAIFADVKMPVFFHIDKFKIKVRPSIYYPVIYVEPDITYTLKDTPQGSVIDLKYKTRVYSASSLEDGGFNSTVSTGLDFHLGAEYPLAEVLGLKEAFKFLDFKVGVDLINLPMIPARMYDYMEMSGRIGGNNVIDLFDLDDDFVTSNDTIYGSEKKRILRPFKMLTWADWKPFEVVPVSFIPTLGFAVSPYYHKPGSIEAGVKTRLDLANLFIPTIGIGYHDRLWKNSIDLILNLRFFEMNLGLDMRSQNFAKSWTGGGFGVNFGLKFGG